MKIVKEEVKTIKEKYVAYDGAEFDKKEDCEEYEKSYKCTIFKSWDNLNKVAVNSVELGLPWSSDDNHVFLANPGTLNDLVAINAFIEYKTGYKNNLTIQDIGKNICLDFGWDFDVCAIYRMENYLEHIKKAWQYACDKLNEQEEQNNG